MASCLCAHRGFVSMLSFAFHKSLHAWLFYFFFLRSCATIFSSFCASHAGMDTPRGRLSEASCPVFYGLDKYVWDRVLHIFFFVATLRLHRLQFSAEIPAISPLWLRATSKTRFAQTVVSGAIRWKIAGISAEKQSVSKLCCLLQKRKYAKHLSAIHTCPIKDRAGRKFTGAGA